MTILDLLRSPEYPKKSILEKLICHYMHITKEQLFTRSDESISDDIYQQITQGYTRYTQHKEPLEYIMGYVEFADLKFAVNRKTLIPRAETEYMIQAVREHIYQQQKTYTLVDIGTGCGVLGLSVGYHCHEHIQQIICTDLSQDALDMAQQNYNSLMSTHDNFPETSFHISDLLGHHDIHSAIQAHSPSIIVSNLPYIPDDLFDKNTDDTVKLREPRMAFVGGDDGLDLYRKMFDQLQDIIDQQDITHIPVLFLEMMTRQAQMLRESYPDRDFEEVKTFHFNIRILRAIPKLSK